METGNCNPSADLPPAFPSDALHKSVRNEVQITAGGPICDQNCSMFKTKKYIIYIVRSVELSLDVKNNKKTNSVVLAHL